VRSRLGVKEQADFEEISGLTPTFAVDQGNIGRNPRSTLGTITGIYDHYRLLFSRIGEIDPDNKFRILINEYRNPKSEPERSGARRSQIRNPKYDLILAPSSLAITLVEGWRGEICHVAITDDAGKIIHYKAKDPSLHNWMALALAVRNQEISDFPLCNKSFNLSYCGNDL
jgi:hypothetical protein